VHHHGFWRRKNYAAFRMPQTTEIITIAKGATREGAKGAVVKVKKKDKIFDSLIFLCLRDL